MLETISDMEDIEGFKGANWLLEALYARS